jgi:hypothetical protein
MGTIIVAAFLLLSCAPEDPPAATVALDVTDADGMDGGDMEPEDCDDGLFCTADSLVEGVCVHEVVPYFCAIDGVCVPDLPGVWEDPKGHPCLACDPAVSAMAWTPANDGFSLGGDDVCCGGVPLPAEECNR